MSTQALFIALGYLAGSVPFGVLVTRWRLGVDVRTQGSGNIGATNVARVGGKSLGAAVLALDALKGAIPVWLSVASMPDHRWLHAGVAFAAVLGHVFPVWLKLKGGKGVATALGVLAVLAPWPALAGACAYAVLFAVWRVSSIGSLVGAVAVLVGVWVGPTPREYAWLTSALFALLLYTHRGNLRRIVTRTEKPL